ncbi:regulator of chromosome condensation 1/beta-lactamase-inhibitor protein II [Dichotomocladium elegans]|nr:regulator of chromosome condensation 1/beta-lactamase-inhibitor protein II [Dichotomocladium elegans]
MTAVYAFGSNGNGQLGIGHTDDVAIPTPCIGLPLDDPIIKIVGGGNHAAALTQSGRVYMAGHWGINQKSSIFFEPPALRGRVWHDVACGWSFTILAERVTGHVFGLGTAKSGEFGGNHRNYGSQSDDSLVHIHVDAPIRVVACGWRHVVGLADDGSVYGWGWNKHGQLGSVKECDNSGSNSSSRSQKSFIQPPLLMSCPKPIVQVACGHVFTIALATDGSVYGFGSNKYGQLQTGDPDGCLITNATSIAAGWHHAAAAIACPNSSSSSSSRKHLRLWGRDDHGQLAGQGIRAESFVCGSEHMLVLVEGQVLAWGWNEHGNCTTHQKSAHEPQKVLLSDSRPVTIIGAGCATSWIGVASLRS